MQSSEYKHVFLIGIGGIGISAVARYFLARGVKVSGSDGSESRITSDLRNEGATIFIGHDASHLAENVDLVVYTIAISDENPELLEAEKRGITCLSYPEALGLLTQDYTTIAVCGTHGKTTTTAMIASMLKACGKNPTVVVGSLLSEGGTNFVKGDSEYLVVEACEYRRSFLNLHPKHVVVTNIDADHLDYYEDLQDIKNAFQEFADKIPEDGLLVTHSGVELSTHGKKVNADLIDTDSIDLSVLGAHNKQNAALALSLALALGLDQVAARKGLKAFNGTWRRLEYKGHTEHGVKVYDDYGHHPTEIKATIEALREAYPKGTNALHIFFQPHLFSRTKSFLGEFAEVLALADMAYIMPIYAAREKDDGTISHYDLVARIISFGGNAVALDGVDDIGNTITSLTDSSAVVLNSGAGDAYTRIDNLHLTH